VSVICVCSNRCVNVCVCVRVLCACVREHARESMPGREEEKGGGRQTRNQREGTLAASLFVSISVSAYVVFLNEREMEGALAQLVSTSISIFACVGCGSL